jgi:hypothetical protein
MALAIHIWRSLIYVQLTLDTDRVYGKRIPLLSTFLPMTHRCHLNVQWPVTSLKYFLSKANMSLNIISDCLILGVAAQCSECHSLPLSLLTHDKTEIASLGPKNGLLYPSLDKTSPSPLLWIPQWQETQMSINLAPTRQSTVTGTSHEDLHVFLCAEVTGWEISRLLFVPWLQ